MIMPEFHKILTDWYKQNKRDLPWRVNNDPYYVWVSEIILQQTRVDQGINYFIRFIDRFPNIDSLANAPENEVLKVWQGLGYYSRARNMHKAAQQVMSGFNGYFPKTYIDIENLKGVGSYTASAIASISYGLPFAVVDGNVFRVLSRIFGIETPIDSTTGKREFTKLANTLLDKPNPGTYNEAIMEFGALQCVPRNPNCNSCPFQVQCVAFNKAEISKLPVKANKTKIRHRYFNYLYLKHEKSIYLEKREQNDIWKNMYQLPLIESLNALSIEELLSSEEFKSLFKKPGVIIDSVGGEIIHLLSHQRLHVKFIEISLLHSETHPTWLKIPLETVSEYPVPRLIDNFLLEKSRNKMEHHS